MVRIFAIDWVACEIDRNRAVLLGIARPAMQLSWRSGWCSSNAAVFGKGGARQVLGLLKHISEHPRQ